MEDEGGTMVEKGGEVCEVCEVWNGGPPLVDEGPSMKVQNEVREVWNGGSVEDEGGTMVDNGDALREVCEVWNGGSGSPRR